MITLLSSLLGFVSAGVPELFRLLRDREDRKHELAVLELQIKQQSQGRSERLEEIRVSAGSAEMQALYRTYSTGIHWVDALNGTVRPALAYAFFFLYALVKTMQFSSGLPWLLWTEEDQAMFAGIMSFYFGQRAVTKARK
jgi:hypothetical protein